MTSPIFTDEDKLIALEEFVVDTTLPRWSAKEFAGLRARIVGGFDEEEMGDESTVRGPYRIPPSITMVRTPRPNPVFNEDDFERSGMSITSGWTRARPPWWRRLWCWGVAVLEPSPTALPPPRLSVVEFFIALKNSAEELTVVGTREEDFVRAIAYAKSNGQVALAEQLRTRVSIARSEAQLCALGLRRVVTEEHVVTFAKQSPRGIRLDWLQNFTRVVPSDVAATKRRADERAIFDNYLVLHYDPKNNANAKTIATVKAEAAARRDPILFGVVSGSRRLYVVGDWIDEHCDLTLDALAKVLGAESFAPADMAAP